MADLTQIDRATLEKYFNSVKALQAEVGVTKDLVCIFEELHI